MKCWGCPLTNAMKTRGFFDHLKESVDLLYGLSSHSFNLICTQKYKRQEALFVMYDLCHSEIQETRYHLLYICDHVQAEQPWWAPLCDKINGCISILRSQVNAQLAAPAYCQAACRLNNLKYSLNTVKGKNSRGNIMSALFQPDTLLWKLKQYSTVLWEKRWKWQAEVRENSFHLQGPCRTTIAVGENGFISPLLISW